MPRYKESWICLPNGEVVPCLREVNDEATEEMVIAAEKSRAVRRRVGTPICTKGRGKKASRGNWVL